MSEFYGDDDSDYDESVGGGDGTNTVLMTWVDNGAFTENNPGSQRLKSNYPDFVKKWVQHGEYVYIEFNPKTGIAKLIPVEEATNKK